jgi:hypothetical protein
MSATEECAAVVAKYNSAIMDLDGAIKPYVACISASRGHDECSVEFSTLRSAQEAFQAAVSRYRVECE